jgi:hypothetical protein
MDFACGTGWCSLQQRLARGETCFLQCRFALPFCGFVCFAVLIAQWLDGSNCEQRANKKPARSRFL